MSWNNQNSSWNTYSNLPNPVQNNPSDYTRSYTNLPPAQNNNDVPLAYQNSQNNTNIPSAYQNSSQCQSTTQNSSLYTSTTNYGSSSLYSSTNASQNQGYGSQNQNPVQGSQLYTSFTNIPQNSGSYQSSSYQSPSTSNVTQSNNQQNSTFDYFSQRKLASPTLSSTTNVYTETLTVQSADNKLAENSEETEGWLWQLQTDGSWKQLYFILDPSKVLLGFVEYPEEGSNAAPIQAFHLKTGMTVTSECPTLNPIKNFTFAVQREPGSKKLVVFDTIHDADRQRWTSSLRKLTNAQACEAWTPWSVKAKETRLIKNQEHENQKNAEETLLRKQMEEQLREKTSEVEKQWSYRAALEKSQKDSSSSSLYTNISNSNSNYNSQQLPAVNAEEQREREEYLKKEEERIRAELEAKYQKEMEERNRIREAEWKLEQERIRQELLEEQKQQVLSWLDDNPDWKDFFQNNLHLTDEQIQDPILVKSLIQKTSSFVIEQPINQSSSDTEPPAPSYDPPPTPSEQQSSESTIQTQSSVEIELNSDPELPSYDPPSIPEENEQITEQPIETNDAPAAPQQPIATNIPPAPEPPSSSEVTSTKVPIPPPAPVSTNSPAPPPPPPPSAPVTSQKPISINQVQLKSTTRNNTAPKLQESMSVFDEIKQFKFSDKPKRVIVPNQLPKQQQDSLTAILSNQMTKFRSKLRADVDEDQEDDDDEWDDFD